MVHVPTYIFLSLIRHIKMEIFPFLSNPLTTTARAKNSQPPASLLKYPINNNKHGIRCHSTWLLYPRSDNVKQPHTNSSAVFFFKRYLARRNPHDSTSLHFRRRNQLNERRILPILLCARDALQDENAARWPALSTKTRPVSAVTTIPPRKRKSNNLPWRLASGKILQ